MYRSLSLLTGLLAATSFGAPVQKRDVAAPPGGDIAILNYALALEFLERKFYETGLGMFTEDDFCALGYDSVFYENLQGIYSDEKTHVEFLSGALGDKAIGEPTFAFPITDIQSFLGLAGILEGVGVSAYLGAAPAIADKAYLTAAGSILTVEARHASYIRAWVGEKPFPGPFDTPLDFNAVFSLAAQFVTGFAEGTDLPFKPFPALTATDPTGAGFTAGQSTVVFTGAHKAAVDAGKGDGAVNAVFYSGLQSYYVPVTVAGDDYTVTIPGAGYAKADQPAPIGQVYVILSSADGTDVMASDDNTISGVGILEVKA
ncbi:Fc.00g066010.m01.CDS01 [Cosmosporella sp. VM-42]